jgi:N,N'-diacetyllegionaminate synthase
MSVYIIAEIGQAHDGSLGSAHAYIDAVADAKVDAVKFQTHIASAESTRHDQFRVNVFPQDNTRYDYWKRMEFSFQQWGDLAAHARDVGLDFLSTPFSKEAVRLLEKLDVPAFKIGSGDVINFSLVDEIIATQKPILLSSGMSSYDELDNTVAKIKASGNDLSIFQCTTSYPCDAKDIGYNVLAELSQRYKCPVGLSDHSGTIFPSIAAVALGAKLIEVHSVFSKQCFGPDTKSSLDMTELKQLVDGIRFIEKGLANSIDKDRVSEEKTITKELFSRSAFYTGDMKAGSVFRESNFAIKKPGGGMNISMAHQMLGKTLKENKFFDDFVSVEDFL